MRNIVLVWTVATVATVVGTQFAGYPYDAFARWLLISIFPIAPTLAAVGVELVRAWREDVP